MIYFNLNVSAIDIKSNEHKVEITSLSYLQKYETPTLSLKITFLKAIRTRLISEYRGRFVGGVGYQIERA
ncbi:hypothetical protein PNC201_10620 [Pseudoalteromonas sp. NC201]|nr:hypothetical protein PNC201_10620 [Pseudoalteromonas sp. NC201]